PNPAPASHLKLFPFMLSHYPQFCNGASLGLVHKLGGLPWGLPASLWPTCDECGRPMSHLGQFPALALEPNAPVLPIGQDEVLFVFKCEWDSVCSFWDFADGANRVFCLPRKELGSSPTQPPAVQAQEDGEEFRILPELGIARWLARDDGAPVELEEAFYDYARHNDLPDDIAHPHDWASEWRTKFGGVPYWTANGAQGQPSIPPGRLLLQIDSWVTMDDGSQTVEVANFCSDGTAYVFIDSTQSTSVLSMIINR
ncbi:MAG: hypothetical protein RLZZ618_1285, partial [Pseudomonadota bacterium]